MTPIWVYEGGSFTEGQVAIINGTLASPRVLASWGYDDTPIYVRDGACRVEVYAQEPDCVPVLPFAYVVDVTFDHVAERILVPAFPDLVRLLREVLPICDAPCTSPIRPPAMVRIDRLIDTYG